MKPQKPRIRNKIIEHQREKTAYKQSANTSPQQSREENAEECN
jgi:hypothetical protein